MTVPYAPQYTILNMIRVNDLIEDPNYLAYRFDFETEAVEFLPLGDGDLSRATWLKREALKSDHAPISVPLTQLIGALNSQGSSVPAKPARFIFHTAYCASTFLSRCLDVEGVSISLREPQILLDAANAKRLQWRSTSNNFDFRHLPALALRLLQKHARANETLIIKPINSVNNIVPELVKANGAGKCLMLYTDARNFLLSTLKKGEEARQTVRAMFDLLRCDFPHLSQLRLTDAIHMSDLKITLTLWRLQLEQAEQLLKHFAPSNVMVSLYAEYLVDEPMKALRAANQFLELGISAEKIEEIGNSGLLFKDAKNTNEGFSAQKRKEKYRAIEAFYGADLEEGYKWLRSNNPATSLDPTLSGALAL